MTTRPVASTLTCRFGGEPRNTQTRNADGYAVKCGFGFAPLGAPWNNKSPFLKSDITMFLTLELSRCHVVTLQPQVSRGNAGSQ
jgi:hypothetical protein